MNVNWAKILVPDTPWLEIVIRGSLVYLSLFLLLRLVLKRQSGAVGITDLLVIVLIADAAQNAMAADYQSVPDGLLLVATIVFWSHALDWLGYRFPAIGRLVHPPPLPLISNGEMVRRNMRHELISEEELRTQLREQGVLKIEDVKMACMEGDGRISVVRSDGEQSSKRREPAP